MRLSSTSLLRAAATLVLLLASTIPLQAQGLIAAGSGMADFFGARRTFAFSATAGPDGQISGQVQFATPSNRLVLHLRIESVWTNGTDFIFAGPVTFSRNGPPVGTYGLFAVRDGGPGNSGDTITWANGDVGPFTASDIVNFFGLPHVINVVLGGYQPLIGGSITAR